MNKEHRDEHESQDFIVQPIGCYTIPHNRNKLDISEALVSELFTRKI